MHADLFHRGQRQDNALAGYAYRVPVCGDGSWRNGATCPPWQVRTVFARPGSHEGCKGFDSSPRLPDSGSGNPEDVRRFRRGNAVISDSLRWDSCRVRLLDCREVAFRNGGAHHRGITGSAFAPNCFVLVSAATGSAGSVTAPRLYIRGY